MRKNNRNSDMPIGKLKKINDFLPPPEELMMPEHTVKITLRLSEESITFFKHQAQKYHTKYQKIIRKLLDAYVKHFAMPH